MPEFAGGGAQRIGVSLANFYATTGMPVTVLVFRDKGPLRNDLLEGIRVVSLDSSSRNPYRKIARALRHLRPSCVLTMYRNVNVPVGLSRLFFSGYRLVVREANTLNAIMEKGGLRRWKNLLKMKLAYRGAARVISNSDAASEELISLGIAESSRITFLPNPVDFERIESLQAGPVTHPWLGAERAEFTIVTSGRLHKQKNQALLIAAFAEASKKYPQLRLIILGEGKLLDTLVKQAQDAGIASFVDFPGFVDNPYPIYANADLFVLPSSFEGFPNVLIEAMACRTPVIATDCPGASAQIIEGGRSGVLVPMDDAPALVGAIERVFTESQAAMVERAYARSRQFSLDAVAQQYAAVLGVA